MTVLTGLLSVAACLAAAVLVVVVLLQEARSGGLVGALRGAEPVFDTSTDAVRRLTLIVAGVWITSSAVLALMLC